MENVKEKLIDELSALRQRLIFVISDIEYYAKVRGELTYSKDDILNVYNRMIHDLEALIDNYK